MKYRKSTMGLITLGLSLALSAGSMALPATAEGINEFTIPVSNMVLTPSALELAAPRGSVVENSSGFYNIFGSKSYNMTLNFDGPTTDDVNGRDYSYAWGHPGGGFFDSATVSLVNSNHESNSTWFRFITVGNMGELTPDAPVNIGINVPAGVTPGKYNLAVKMQQKYIAYNDPTYTEVVSGLYNISGTFTVVANTSNSKDATISKYSGKKGSKKKLTVKVHAPDYLAGAKVTAYYRANGWKTYHNVGTGRLDTDGYDKFYTGKGKIRHGGRMYIKISSVAYASGYNTNTMKIK